MIIEKIPKISYNVALTLSDSEANDVYIDLKYIIDNKKSELNDTTLNLMNKLYGVIQPRHVPDGV